MKTLLKAGAAGVAVGTLLTSVAYAYEDVSCSLTATPSHAAPGEQVTLTWNSYNARSANLDGFGTVPLQGTRTITVSQTRDYRVYMEGYNNTHVGCVARVTVAAKQPTCRISVVPFAIASNSFATLSWTTENADSVFISGVGDVQAKGNTMVRATNDRVYSLYAQSRGGSCEASATLQVNDPYDSYGYIPQVITNIVYPLSGYRTQNTYEPTYYYSYSYDTRPTTYYEDWYEDDWYYEDSDQYEYRDNEDWYGGDYYSSQGGSYYTDENYYAPWRVPSYGDDTNWE